VIYVLVILIIFVALLALLAKAKAGSGGTVGYPYVPAKRLFSEAERIFLVALDEAVDDTQRVFGKVRLADVAAPRPGLGRSAQQGALNRVASKHFDFVICRRSDLAIVCAVELNDRSHGSKRAQARDELVAGVCAAIGLPLLTVPAKASYSVQELRLALAALLVPSADSRSPAPGSR
jgi:hypothetical protein